MQTMAPPEDATAERFARLDERFDRTDERIVDVDRRVDGTAKETDRRLKEVNRRITEGYESTNVESPASTAVERRLDNVETE